MVQFNKLRITGFKSFADNTELDILPGLTGIIGPNGCGKSNVTESLRWVMGENSAKSMRGGGMDDVIFAGTNNRTARNFAEVVLTVQNDLHNAPEPFTNTETLEISRRIDRGMGSDYRINGKVMRASDIQLLFADSSTGAHSPSIVSQGRITHLVNAKPIERRRVLEDAAAISGLHNRRKEAEQKLRAAEKNLLRVDDLLTQKTATYEQLVKQAKQAQRYRSLSDTIRRLDVQMIALEWRKIDQDAETAENAMIAANEQQNEIKLKLHETQQERNMLQQQHAVLTVRYEELQQQANKIWRDKERAEEELTRHAQSKRDLEQQQSSLTHDNAHEAQMISNAENKLAQLTQEQAQLETQLSRFTDDYQASVETRDTARGTFDTAAEQTQTHRQQLTTVQTQSQFLQQNINNIAGEQQRLQNDLTRTQEALAELQQHGDLNAQLEAAQTQQQAATQTVQTQQERLVSLEKQAEGANDAVKQAYDVLQTANGALRQVDTEIKALTALTASRDNHASFKTALDQTQVNAGYERALTMALGRELHAGLDINNPFYWQTRSTNSLPPLPAGVTALVDVVDAPDALHAALQMVGVVENETHGSQLQAQLLPGQLLVSLDGFGWRWDGYTVTPQAEQFTQERDTRQLLQQRNRLKELQAERVPAEAQVTTADAHYQTMTQQQQDVRQSIQDCRSVLSDAQRTVQASTQSVNQLQQRVIETHTRINALTEKQQDLAQRLAQQESRLSGLQAERDALPDVSALQAVLADLQRAQQTAEHDYRQAEQHYLALSNQQQQSQQRQRELTQQQQDWQRTYEQSQQRLSVLQERAEKIATALNDLPSPDHWQEQMLLAETTGKALQGDIANLQTERNAFQQQDRVIEQQLEATQEAFMQVREQFARAETQHHNAQENRTQLQERCIQQLDDTIENVLAQMGDNDELNIADLQQLRGKHERARGERDRLGAINLRADEEATELKDAIDTLTIEKVDVQDAIDKLRTGISTLNRDARKKMLVAFEQVNTRFRDVFSRLFSGGEAYLQLVDAEDPLEAGLEIFACPPGKKLQQLSLLSGGEQTMTATALIFAMFLTQPSPICILDEIDAALDDANVERICDLLREFAATHPTRFIVITHNSITMSYMDRLYGVTMAEKGVSKLVSVDLAQTTVANDLFPQDMAVAAE